MSYSDEFQTVDLLVNSSAEMRGVDAFTLCLIKAERQMRRLVTHLLYQFPYFGPSNIGILRDTIAENKRLYFEGFECGFNAIYPKSIKELVGAEYDRLHSLLDQAIGHRNKIFHGQITSKCLTRCDLLNYVVDIRAWCKCLAQTCLAEFQYDGFIRNSFQKSKVAGVWTRFKLQLVDVKAYDEFIRQHMQRH